MGKTFPLQVRPVNTLSFPRRSSHISYFQKESNSDAVISFASGASPATAIPVDTNQQLDVEDLDVDIDKLLDVNSTICIEKEIAADTIGALIASTARHFLPYVEQCTVELIGQLPHYYDGIRKSATESLLEIVRSFYDLSGAAEWKAGAEVVVPLDERVKQLVGHVLPPLLDMYETEDNK